MFELLLYGSLVALGVLTIAGIIIKRSMTKHVKELREQLAVHEKRERTHISMGGVQIIEEGDRDERVGNK